MRESTSFKMPPGCRFYPSEEQLLCCYLTGKNRNTIGDEDGCEGSNGYDLIKELNLYDYEPYELPDSACFSYGCKARKRHWFCYTIRVLKGSSGTINRRTKGGYWRRRGRVRDVMSPGEKLPVGTRTRFVFYLGNSLKNSVRTDWVMYEYALLDHIKAAFVLCRMLVKSRSGNSRSENVFSSCAEESVSAVRHIGVQHDGFLIADVAEAEVYHGTSIEQSKDVKLSETDGDIFATRSANELLCILKGEFIELDDLVP